MAVQIAKAVGARVIAVVSGSSESPKAKMLLDIGCDAVVDYHESKWEDKVKALMANGEGVDVVYDSIGAIESGIRCLRYRGRLVIVGFAARGGKIEEVRANRILLKGITVTGYVSCSSCFPPWKDWILSKWLLSLLFDRGSAKTDVVIRKSRWMLGKASWVWSRREISGRSFMRRSIRGWAICRGRWRI